MRPRRLLLKYAAGLTTAYLLTVAEVVGIVVALAGRGVVTLGNIVTLSAVGLIGVTTVALGAVLILRPSLRWLKAGRRPTPAEIRTTSRITRRQSAITLAPWLLTAAVLVPLNLHAEATVFVVLTTALLFGAIATVCTGFLFTLRTLRPVLAAVPADAERPPAPGVRARLLIMWVVCTALPGSAIAVLLVMRYREWLLDESSPIELALLVLALVAVVLGLRAMILVSMSISDPVNQVVDAMADVEKGEIDRTIDVYEWSEIGRLQSGFNRMVAGLRERDRLRDLFGRHVGEEVARRAFDQAPDHEASSGDERDVAILFIDLVGSTELAAAREPHAVAQILNDFFQIVVAEVDRRHGLINKFQGDAALAVFGAPLRIADPATAAMATARALRSELRRLPVDFGIGVSAGPVFAGNIGAENRYEYTVVGDAVNEAARLADHAKDFDSRTLCSGTAHDRASPAERALWAGNGQTTLRGRAGVTDIFAPSAR
ncbi:adenylate/guanylate cyclase domain-containing protein [Mycobacterium sp. 236(2023)]|uniref:adenylate/guanylate cyclase domain-containing protein n=1 Tax=Mycobacterium sp. 236(2023) TaxID=3038163 RepID=UPI0024158380|nr:adenylate/guanylate cyclase domain-containing protein [Mycobacterium sp. 236(2023)]MDG4668593.1 adenylate/guanylate cyclase domain-containing protein [Mycobacterium sp. 236(2023)]